MSFGGAKIYFDGSHYIAIPSANRSAQKKHKPPEEAKPVLKMGIQREQAGSVFWDDFWDSLEPRASYITKTETEQMTMRIEDLADDKKNALNPNERNMPVPAKDEGKIKPTEIRTRSKAELRAERITESRPEIKTVMGIKSESKSKTETVSESKPISKTEPNPNRKLTKKELFNQLYDSNQNLSKARRRAAIIAAVIPYFNDEDAAAQFVDKHLERKKRNLIVRRTRYTRKAALQEFNYFVTFTYSDKLHTEQSFQKKLKSCLSHFYTRNAWKYIGVWERSPEKKRLHFHGVFRIPDGTMPGQMFEKRDYSFSARERRITHQNTYFNDNFGRSDFEKIEDRMRVNDAMAYIFKYIEKTGERIVSSKGLPQFFISDIMDEDVVCKIGTEDKKLLLFDDFNCWDEGCHMGRVSKETIRKMRTTN